MKNRPAREILENEMYRVAEIAAALKCSTITIYRALESKHLKSYRVGRGVICSGAQILDWLNRGGKTF